MKKYLVLLLFFIQMSFYAQKKEAVKPNSIIFGEITAGLGFKNTGSGIVSLHYQHEKSLFSYRFSRLRKSKLFITSLFPIVPAYYTPLIKIKAKEYAFLYGRRFVENDFSYSFSGGVSYTKSTNIPKIYPVFTDFYMGFPFEINIKWFKSEKRSIMLFGLIPITKPTGFGSSLGVKLFGNLSKQSYIGIGVTFGLGYYKNYRGQ